MPINKIYDTLKYCYVFTTWGIFYVFFPQEPTLGSGVPNAKMSKTPEASVLKVALVQGGGTSDYFGWWMRSDKKQQLQIIKVGTFGVPSISKLAICSWNWEDGTRVGWWCDTKESIVVLEVKLHYYNLQGVLYSTYQVRIGDKLQRGASSICSYKCNILMINNLTGIDLLDILICTERFWDMSIDGLQSASGSFKVIKCK